MLTLIIAALYFVSGRLGLLMAIPPGFATAVWPPSGLAVAAALLYGPRVLPGVFLGSTLVNLSLSVEQWQWSDIQAALPVAIPIAVGSSLQAWVASALVRRSFTIPSPLIDPREILLLSLLAGPMACLIAASVGTATLYSLELVTLTNAPIGWFTWWVGDVIGVLVFTPLILVMVTKTPNNPIGRRLQVSLPLILAFALAIVVFFWARSTEQARIDDNFSRRALIEEQGLERHASNMVSAVGAIKGLYAASNFVDSNEFSRFYAELVEHYSGLEAAAWVKRVPLEEREAFESALSEQEFSSPYIRVPKIGETVPAPQQAEYFPIFYNASRLSFSNPVIGLDLSAEALRLAAMRKARAEHRLIATAPITLTSSPNAEPAIILFLPLFSDELPKGDADGELLGFIVGMFVIDNFVNSALSVGRERDLILHISDVTNPDQPIELYHEQEHQQSDIGWEKIFDFGSRQWHIRLTPTPQYLRELHGHTIWWVLMGGMLFVWLTGALLLILTGRESLVRQEVIEKTQQLRHALHKANDASEAKSRFLASMSHELRTPLNSIIGFTSRLLRKAGDRDFDQRTVDSLTTIERNGQHLLELINDILDVTKIEAGEMVLNLESIQVQEVVDEVSKKIAPLLSAEGLDYRVLVDKAVGHLQADRRRLVQILLNLFSNALKFTEQGSITLEVTPETRSQQAGLRFSVTDTGIGISSQDQQRLFQRFSQIDSRVTKTVEGTGLGLVLVKEFAEIHGGEVEVCSEVGKGSQFSVWLPLTVTVD